MKFMKQHNMIFENDHVLSMPHFITKSKLEFLDLSLSRTPTFGSATFQTSENAIYYSSTQKSFNFLLSIQLI